MDASQLFNLTLYFGLVTILLGGLLLYGFRKKGILIRETALASSGTLVTGLGMVILALLLPSFWVGFCVMCTGFSVIAGGVVLQIVRIYRIRRRYHG